MSHYYDYEYDYKQELEHYTNLKETCDQNASLLQKYLDMELPEIVKEALGEGLSYWDRRCKDADSRRKFYQGEIEEGVLYGGGYRYRG